MGSSPTAAMAGVADEVTRRSKQHRAAFEPDLERGASRQAGPAAPRGSPRQGRANLLLRDGLGTVAPDG